MTPIVQQLYAIAEQTHEALKAEPQHAAKILVTARERLNQAKANISDQTADEKRIRGFCDHVDGYFNLCADYQTTGSYEPMQQSGLDALKYRAESI